MVQTHTDQEILQQIKQGKDDQALRQLYKTLLPKIQSFIQRNQGTEADAHDIFQDAILIFYKQVKMGKFNAQFEIGAFVFSVSRNLWINQAKKNKRSVHITEEMNQVESKDDFLNDLITEERVKQIQTLLKSIGERCKQLLTYSIFDRLSMKEICEKMGFSTENGAKTRNYKCKQKLIEAIKKHPQFHELVGK